MIKKKKVNVYADSRAIYSLNPPIMRTAMGIELSIGDIQRCIWAKGQVEEVLEDGTVVKLDLNNFDKDNSYLMKKSIKPIPKKFKKNEQKEVVKPEPVVEAVKVKEVVEPVVVETEPVKEQVVEEEVVEAEPVKEQVVEEEVVETQSIQEKILKELKKEEPAKTTKKEFVNKQAFKAEK